MTVYMDLENLLKEKNISKNKVCDTEDTAQQLLQK